MTSLREPETNHRTADDNDPNNPARRRAEEMLEAEQQSGYNPDLGERTKPERLTKDGASESLSGAESAPKWKVTSDKFGGKEQAGGSFAQRSIAKIKVFGKKKGAIAGLIALVGGGTIIPFFGATSLPFAILGNANVYSIMQQLNPFIDDFSEFQLFGVKGKNTIVTTRGNAIAGLTDAQVEKLRSNPNTKLIPENGRKTASGKTIFDAIEVDGTTITADNYKSTLKSKPHLRKSLIIPRSSLWKASKGYAGSFVKARYRLPLNPDVSGRERIDSDKKLINSSVVDADGRVSPTVGTQSDPDAKPNLAVDADGVAANFSDQLEASRAAVAEGQQSLPRLPTNNTGSLFTREAADLDVLLGQTSIGSKAWGFINSLDAADMVCTLYQSAYLANVAARGVMLANIMRYGYTFIAGFEKAKDGDDANGQINYLLSILNNKDPDTGLSFDASSYAALLFTGKLSTEPSSVSAMGGQAMLSLMMGMRAVHSVAGFGDVGTGRAFLKTACGIATNVIAQVGATVVGVVVAIFTGGTAIAAKQVSTGLIKKGAKDLIERMQQQFGRDARERILKDLGEKGIKDIPRMSRTTLSAVNRTLSGWDKVGILIAGVSLFGMDAIVKALTGEHIIDTMQSGFSSMEAIGTARQHGDYVTAIGAGGSVTTYAKRAAATPQLNEYRDQYIAQLRDEAKATPFDIKNPYSVMGSMLFSSQKALGFSKSLEPSSAIASLLKAPIIYPGKLFSDAASAAEGIDPAAVGAYVGNEFYIENEIATQVTGSPDALIPFRYTFSDVLEQLAYNSEPQIEIEGVDEISGEINASIIPNSELAEYKDTCHNQEKINVDIEYATDETIYDLECQIDGPKYNALYSNAITYLDITAPDTDLSTFQAIPASTQAGTVGSCSSPATRTEAQTGWGGHTNGRIPLTELKRLSWSNHYLHPDAACGFEALNEKFREQFGTNILISGPRSAYRSYEEQVAIKAELSYLAAEPGTSNHGWGLAADLSSGIGSFGSAQHKWMQANAPAYGWVNPPWAQQGGRKPEPWHWEYAREVQ